MLPGQHPFSPFSPSPPPPTPTTLPAHHFTAEAGPSWPCIFHVRDAPWATSCCPFDACTLASNPTELTAQHFTAEVGSSWPCIFKWLQNWGERWGSNPRQPESQSGTLPTELRSPYYCPNQAIPGLLS